MKRFVKILLINHLVGILEVILYYLAMFAETGVWKWNGIIAVIFISTQTFLITVKYWYSLGKIDKNTD